MKNCQKTFRNIKEKLVYEYLLKRGLSKVSECNENFSEQTSYRTLVNGCFHRSSHRRCSIKKSVLKHFAKIPQYSQEGLQFY